jgi:hypothetical protein
MYGADVSRALSGAAGAYGGGGGVAGAPDVHVSRHGSISIGRNRVAGPNDGVNVHVARDGRVTKQAWGADGGLPTSADGKLDFEEVERWTQNFDAQAEQESGVANGERSGGSSSVQERSMQKFYQRMEKSRKAAR